MAEEFVTRHKAVALCLAWARHTTNPETKAAGWVENTSHVRLDASQHCVKVPSSPLSGTRGAVREEGHWDTLPDLCIYARRAHCPNKIKRD